MYKIPFFIGNLIACFVPNNKRRSRVRGWVNVILFRPWVVALVRRTYGIRPKHVRFVRQITLNRMSCVVDDKYYVKVFRNADVNKLHNLKKLLDFIRPHISVEISDIVVHKHIPMYVRADLFSSLACTEKKESSYDNPFGGNCIILRS